MSTNITYDDFIARKMALPEARGLTVDPAATHPALYPFQRILVSRALRAGRYALFTDTGTGKTAMQVVWASHVARQGRVLILAPLAVAEQTVREAARFGVEVRYLRRDDGASPIVIANYELLEHFAPEHFAGIVLDESSILKSYDGSTRTAVIEAFRTTPFRLACTATPAPNDHAELGNHAEFLGVKSRTEMLAEFFVHDGGSTSDWRLKGHARQSFWRWLGGWASVLRKPSDLGFADDGFALPPLEVRHRVLALNHADARASGLLFIPHATTLSEQRALRRSTLERRVEQIAALAADDDPCLIWCELNAEADAVADAIPDAVQVAGADDPEDKARNLLGFADGAFRVLVTKPSIAGFGMNWQRCAHVIFAGVSHSFEQTYQAIRRCWRFGQTRPVRVDFVCTEADSVIVENYRRKAEEHDALFSEMARCAGEAQVSSRWNDYNPTRKLEVPSWLTSEA